MTFAEKMRPGSFDEVVGQEHLVGACGVLRQVAAGKRPISVLLWGPPGCGKTTILRILAAKYDPNFLAISPISTGVNRFEKNDGGKEIKAAIQSAACHVRR